MAAVAVANVRARLKRWVAAGWEIPRNSNARDAFDEAANATTGADRDSVNPGGAVCA